jgi:glycosyltransferase involved in cell wall biosynthesis
MLKVCMVVHQNYYQDGRVRRYVDTLLGAGADVDVICLRSAQAATQSQTPNPRVYAIPMTKGTGNSRGGYLLEYFRGFILFAAWLVVLYARKRYHVIHVHNMPDFLIFTALIPRLFGARLVLDIHDPMPEFYMSKYDDPQPDRLMVRIMRLQEKASAGLAHAVITANPNFKNNLIQRGISAAKITVISNLPDTALFDRDKYHDTQPTGEDFTLIYPGTLAPRYGLDVAVRAIPLLIERIPRLRLVFIGPESEYRQELVQLAQRLGVSQYVQCKPVMPIHEIPGQMAQADLGIYPALPDPHMDIATPSKVLEFAVMGLPVVASRIKVLESLFGDDAIMFFTPGDASDFADCVLQLHANPARRAELVRNADRVFVHVHRWIDEEDRYLRLLGDITGTATTVVTGDEAEIKERRKSRKS